MDATAPSTTADLHYGIQDLAYKPHLFPLKSELWIHMFWSDMIFEMRLDRVLKYGWILFSKLVDSGSGSGLNIKVLKLIFSCSIY